MDFGTQARERDFHDDWAASIEPGEVRVIETFRGSTSPEQRWLVTQMGNLAGKRILELGTGAGEGAIFFALQGGKVVATDLSQGMLNVVTRVAELHGVSVECRVCPAEDLSIFPDSSFDIVYAANLLHHVDIGACLDEVRRVLRDGGIGCFCDPVAHNPVINVYRRMATEVRTTDEHPIRRRDMQLYDQRFRSVHKRFFWLTTLLIFVKFYLVDRVHPNEERYWERVLIREEELRPLFLRLEKIDIILLRLFPFLGWFCWNVAVVVTK